MNFDLAGFVQQVLNLANCPCALQATLGLAAVLAFYIRQPMTEAD